MTPDLIWPSDLHPSTVSFYLQAHVGGQESPITRTTKKYGLSRPRWLCKMTFKASWRGGVGTMARGSRLDALIAEMEGGLYSIGLWDFRRPYPAGLRRYYSQFAGLGYPFAGGETFALGERFIIPADAEPANEAAAAGAITMTFSGFRAGELVFHAGDYLGGDGRGHLILRDAMADANGRATVRFTPPLEAAVPAGTAITMQPLTTFQLRSDDAGDNQSTANGQASYSLEFSEKLI
jgi:hypothetical protein